MRALLTSLFVAFFTVGCVTGKPLSADKLANISPLRVTPPATSAEGSIYNDSTSATLNVVGSQTGLAGALLFGGIAELNRSAGVRKFSAATGGLSKEVERIVVGESLAGVNSRGLNDRAGASGGQLRLSKITYGVSHIGKQQFRASVVVAGEIQDAAGKAIWRNSGIGGSSQSFTADETKATPRIYADAVGDAAVSAASDLAVKYSGR